MGSTDVDTVDDDADDEGGVAPLKTGLPEAFESYSIFFLAAAAAVPAARTASIGAGVTTGLVGCFRPPAFGCGGVCFFGCAAAAAGGDGDDFFFLEAVAVAVAVAAERGGGIVGDVDCLDAGGFFVEPRALLPRALLTAASAGLGAVAARAATCWAVSCWTPAAASAPAIFAMS